MRGLLKYRRWLIVASQTVLIVATYYAAYQIDFDFDLTLPGNLAFLHTLPLVVVIKILLFRRLGLLGGWWRYAGMSEALDVIRAAGVSSGILFVVFGLLWRLPGLHLTVLVVDLCLTVMVTGGARFAVRAYTEQASASYFEPRNALIVGAGRVGSAIARELREHPELNYSPVGFVDDDSRKLGIKIHGVTVLGTTHDLLRVIAAYNVDCAVIAVRSAPGNLVQRVIEQCQQRKVELKIAPASAERMNGLAFSLMRNVSPEDLLGRTPVRLDPDPIRAKIENKIVLITGAGGSIGSELARQVAHFKPSQLLLFDRSENDLFRLGTEFSRNFPMLNYVQCIGDILDVRTLRDVFALYRPSSVFHAAAYKHVPMMEVNPWQAVTNNIFGTYNVALVAREHQADDFILVSTDKAVNPTNIMGVSKRVAELIILALQQQHTRFTAVRFGNVLGSNGSVLPLFQQQIAARGPLTVTHPDVTRYFMTIPEAVQLVLQASAMGRGGEIFVLDMGRSVRILDLANNVIRISGLVPERDVQIVFTGLRPGEKLFEELSLAAEGLKTTAHEKIRVLDGGRTDMAEVVRWLDDLSRLVDSRNINGLITALVGIVPQYRPSAEVLAMSAVDRYDYSQKYLRDRAALTAVLPPSTAA
jgi:FlaA1/EpsC-like NDP-sugar epimerase